MRKPTDSALGTRIKQAMERQKMSESDLVAATQRLVGREDDGLRNKLSQQMMNHLISGGGERSFYTPIIAAALGVNALWLAFGIGAEITEVPRSHRQLLADSERESQLLIAFRNADPSAQIAVERAIESRWREAVSDQRTAKAGKKS